MLKGPMRFTNHAVLATLTGWLCMAIAGAASALPLAVGDIVYTDGENIIHVDPVTGERTIIVSPGNVNTVVVEPGGTIVANSGGLLKRFFSNGTMQTILGTPSSPDILDLALGSDGALVYTDGDGVYLVDESSGSGLLLRQPGNTRTVAISPSGLVYFNFGQFLKGVDPMTGASIRVDNGAGFREVRDMTVGAMGMIFYTDGYGVYKVDPRTGKRVILLRPNDTNSVAMGEQGFAYNRDALIAEANVVTWRKNQIPGGKGLDRVQDLAIVPTIVPTPEPSSALLLAIGFAFLIGARRRVAWLQLGAEA